MQAIEANSTGTGVILESARDIPMQSPREIWKDWLYVAKVHLLAGPPSTGKTTIAMTMAATISTGGLWPDGSCSPRGRVVIWSSEDGIEDTVIPRLVAAGADLSNIEVLRMTVENWSRRQFDPVRDLRLLEDKIRQLGDVALVIIDSIAELMPGSPGNNNKVRKSLFAVGRSGRAYQLRCGGADPRGQGVQEKASARANHRWRGPGCGRAGCHACGARRRWWLRGRAGVERARQGESKYLSRRRWFSLPHRRHADPGPLRADRKFADSVGSAAAGFGDGYPESG
ncbi:hypothetical protein Y600_6164 [Burkholderia pseudomallei MSHR3709]|nr:hypothetical protein Y600_6164 [Burkholderia pseudomallei MSHR3709]